MQFEPDPRGIRLDPWLLKRMTNRQLRKIIISGTVSDLRTEIAAAIADDEIFVLIDGKIGRVPRPE